MTAPVVYGGVDFTALAERVRGLDGVVDVEVTASVVCRSPFPYVYAYLSGDRMDGPHVILSQAAEWEEAAMDTFGVSVYTGPDEEDEVGAEWDLRGTDVAVQAVERAVWALSC